MRHSQTPSTVGSRHPSGGIRPAGSAGPLTSFEMLSRLHIPSPTLAAAGQSLMNRGLKRIKPGRAWLMGARIGLGTLAAVAAVLVVLHARSAMKPRLGPGQPRRTTLLGMWAGPCHVNPPCRTHSGTDAAMGMSTGKATEIGAAEEEENLRRITAHLMERWAAEYGLNEHRPPRVVQPPPHWQPAVPAAGASLAAQWAPHLEECARAARWRRELETHPSSTEYPAWTCTKQARKGVTSCRHPKTPWVVGSDDDNLPLTRVVQRDLWVHQFPPNCSDPSLKFLILNWPLPSGHGVGSQLHIMSVALSIAVASGRILVPARGSFLRANHTGCQRIGRNSSFECYFFPITPAACTRHAYSLAKASIPPMWERWKDDADLPDRSIALSYSAALWPLEASAARYLRSLYIVRSAAMPVMRSKWGSPWLDAEPSLVDPGLTKNSTDAPRRQAQWWRSQSVRFFLRWPSAYLCHLTNKARHSAYGHEVAQQIAQVEIRRIALEQNLHKEAPMAPSQVPAQTRGESPLISPSHRSWRTRFPQEPYMPRPIVSVHARQGDKKAEMQVQPLEALLWLAQQARLLAPNTHHMWLSSESQNVINDASVLQEWTVLHTSEVRQMQNMDSSDYESLQMETIAAAQYVNILIAAQCDFFVGTLASNWDRVINELRLTNGRLRSPYMALNSDEW